MKKELTKKIKTNLECDYCYKKVKKLVDTPYMADIPAKMCKKCWQCLNTNTVGTFENPNLIIIVKGF